MDRKAQSRVSIARISSGHGGLGRPIFDPESGWPSDQLASDQKQRVPKPGSIGPRSVDEVAPCAAFGGSDRFNSRPAPPG